MEGSNTVSDADKKQTEGMAGEHFSGLSPRNLLMVDFSAMEIDQDPTTSRSKSTGKGRIEKRRGSRKTSIVFPKYKNGKKIGRSKGKK